MIKSRGRTTYKTSGFVLGAIDYGDSDRIVTFYTDRYGKLKGIAKGARRSTRRFANALELFSLSTVMLSRSRGSGLALIENCDVVNHYSGIRNDLEKLLGASYMIELIDHMTLEGKKSLVLFNHVKAFLDLVDANMYSDDLIHFFELRLLRYSGYDPVLDRCIVCNTPVDGIEKPCFSVIDGGIRCGRCRDNGRPQIPVSVGTLKALLMSKEIDIDKINRLSLSRQSLKESEAVLCSIIEHTIGKQVKSLKILRQIQGIVENKSGV
ncbi:MAG: DNA repair protein RecO [Deltaproteobacteria bacterium]|nr:DNA repair protein RecO [Deltaproteobacteria bacterium]MBN2688694.1 DNA repair protein RecO [Deltaproteobacteria bacterium]